MAESKSVAIISLNGSNYPTWKIQCRMALLKDGSWSIVSETEVLPAEGEQRAKFLARRDRALAIIVLSVQPSLYSTFLVNRTTPSSCGKSCRTSFRKRLGRINWN